MELWYGYVKHVVVCYYGNEIVVDFVGLVASPTS